MGWVRTRNRERLLEHVPPSIGEPKAAREIAKSIDWPWQTVKAMLEELHDEGRLERTQATVNRGGRVPPYLYRRAGLSSAINA